MGECATRSGDPSILETSGGPEATMGLQVPGGGTGKGTNERLHAAIFLLDELLELEWQEDCRRWRAENTWLTYG